MQCINPVGLYASCLLRLNGGVHRKQSMSKSTESNGFVPWHIKAMFSIYIEEVEYKRDR